MGKILLMVIYLAFIGLGIPDSLFGTAWPAIYGDLALPIPFGSFVTVTTALGTIFSSLMSGRLIAALGTGRVTAFSTLLTGAALLGFSLAPSIWWMVGLALPLGIGAGAVDVALNHYVALHYGARQMNFVHCICGIGVAVSPYLLSLVIRQAGGWRLGYRMVCLIQLGIGCVLLAALRLWQRDPQNLTQEVDQARSLTGTWNLPGVKQMCAILFLTCGIEYTCGGWGSTFLVEHRGFTTPQAARVMMLYFLGMALGRFLSGLEAKRLDSWQIVRWGELLLGCGIVALCLPGPRELYILGFFLIGLGNGPLFPNFNCLGPEFFGKGASGSVVSLQMAAAYTGILLVPLLGGWLGQALGMGAMPVYLLAGFTLMGLLTSTAKKAARHF